jgi:hypothetical protein
VPISIPVPQPELVNRLASAINYVAGDCPRIGH